MLALSVLGANQRQVVVLADLLVQPQRLPQRSLLVQLVLDLLGALQQLVGLLVRREGDGRNDKTAGKKQTEIKRCESEGKCPDEDLCQKIEIENNEDR